MKKIRTKAIGIVTLVIILLSAFLNNSVQAQTTNPSKPNILVIWGDDIGWQNVSAYGMGSMGYTTPNIDRWALPTLHLGFLSFLS